MAYREISFREQPMTDTKWFFPTTQGGEESGLNDPGIEFFRRSGSLARETLQNSGDARVSDDKPVSVTFELLQLPVDQLPDATRLRQVIANCRDYMLHPCKTERQKDENGRKWFEQALQLLSGKHLPVLRIRDENTTGLEGGEKDEDKAWFRLIKKQGSASMHGAGGGTFGIGQRAPFAFSSLRTVFYSTLTRDGQHAFIGKTILSSFREEGQVHRPIGFWGTHARDTAGVHAVRNAEDIPELFRRTTVGTDLYIMGFELLAQGWQAKIADSVVRNFFAAIHGGGLVVRLVDGDNVQLLNAATIDQLVDARHREVLNAATSKAAQKEVRDTLGATRHYLRALSVPVRGRPSFSLQHAHLGRLDLYVTLDPEAPSRTAFMRRPRILIYERTQNLFPGYAAVLICEEPKGNDLLARMEDPSHSEWNRERLPGGVGTPSGDRLLTDIYAFIRDSLKELAKKDPDVPEDLPDLGRYLPEDDAIRPGVRQTGTRVRTKHVTEQETARPQQARGRKRSVQRPRPLSRPQVLLLPLDSGDQGESEALATEDGSESVGMSGSGSLIHGGSMQHGVVNSAGVMFQAGMGSGGTEGSGPEPGPVGHGSTGSGNTEGSQAGSVSFGPARSGQIEWPNIQSGVGPSETGNGQAGRQGGPQSPLDSNTPSAGSGSGLRTLSQAQLSVRAWFSSEDGSTHLLLRATRRGRATLQLTASGEDSDYELQIASAVDVRTGEQFDCVGDRVRNVAFDAGQGKELRLDLRPARRVALSIEVVHGA